MPAILVIDRLLKFLDEVALHPSGLWNRPIMFCESLVAEHPHALHPRQGIARRAPHLNRDPLPNVWNVLRHQSEQAPGSQISVTFSNSDAISEVNSNVQRRYADSSYTA